MNLLQNNYFIAFEKHVDTELTTEGARSTQKPKDNGTGIKKKSWHNNYDIIVGTVWPHLRAKVRRRRLKKATPAGPKKEAPGVKFDPPRGPISRRGESQTGFWRPPKASWAPGRPQEGILGEKRAVGKLYGGLLGPSWGPLGAS